MLSDDSDKRARIKAILDEHGYEVLCSSSLDAYKKTLLENNPAVVILIGDDPTVLDKAWRALTPDRQWQSKPYQFVIHTDIHPKNKSRAISAGVDEFLSWPIDPGELVHRITAAMHQQRSRREARENTDRLEEALDTVRRYNAAFSAELDEAKVIQEVFFPRQRLISNGFGINFSIRPAQKLCGDFIDITRLDTFRVVLTLMDVSGHGSAAAMVTGMIHAWLHANIHTHVSLANKTEELNTYLLHYIPDIMYATGFIGILDTMIGNLEYVLAGHPEPLVWKADKQQCHYLQEASTPPLGLHRDFKATVMRCNLQPGDALLVYSDGLLDALPSSPDPHKEIRHLYEHHNRNLGCLRERKCRFISDLLALGQEPEDDMTMLCIARFPDPLQHGKVRVSLPGTGHYEFTMPSVEQAVRDLQDFLVNSVRPEIGESCFWDILQVVSELVYNAMEWGNRFDENKKVHCVFTFDQSEARVVVSGEGKGFNVKKVLSGDHLQDSRLRKNRRPGGFGLKICKSICDELSFSDNGNQVEAVFYLSSSDQQSTFLT